MKKILFVINNMNMGGIQKALTALLSSAENLYDITLLPILDGGVCLKNVPDTVKVLSASPALKVSELSLTKAKEMGFKWGALRTFCSAVTRLGGKKFASYIALKSMGRLEDEYDMAISFCQPLHSKLFCNLANEVVLNCVNAKKKVTFIHCDFARYGGNCKYNRNLLQKFDAIAAVSDSVGKIIKALVPNVYDRVITVENCHDFDEILKQAEESPVEYHHRLNIVSVGRLSAEKGFLRVIPMIKRLVDSGKDVGLNIVGGGPDYDQLKNAICENKVEDYITLWGEQENPYRFLKNADLFFMPSYHEAAPMVFGEAASLGVPILTTDTLSARELVENRGLGIVCDNTDEAIYEALYAIAENPEVTDEFSQQRNLDNGQSLKQFAALFDMQEEKP